MKKYLVRALIRAARIGVRPADSSTRAAAIRLAKGGMLSYF